MKSLKIARVSGFSLIELMVVVGIIGVLATIAIPQYSKFSSRAKQSEAKVNLGGIYTVEKAYFVEGSQFSPCLAKIGYEASGEQRRYFLGFNDFTATSFSAGGGGSISCGDADKVEGQMYFVNKVGTAMTTGHLLKNSKSLGTITTATFKAGAVGFINGKTADTDLDMWSINENQKLENENPAL